MLAAALFLGACLLLSRAVIPGLSFRTDGRPTIGIDPGHGGIDAGTSYGQVLEKDINLQFSVKLKQALSAKGYRAVLSRDGDYLLSPHAKSTIRHHPYKRHDLCCRIEKLEAAGANLIISIHGNWNRQSYHRGPTVFYYTGSEASRSLAEKMQAELNAVQPYRKIPKPAQYFMLRESKVPALLIEIGFLSNAEDCRLIQTDEYQRKLIEATIKGLDAAFKARLVP